jgi:hypothetical protein
LRHVLAFAWSGEGFRRRLGAAVARLTESNRLENRLFFGQCPQAPQRKPDIWVASTLLMAQVDLRRGVLDELRQRRIKETIEEVIEDLSDHVDEPVASAPAPEAAPTDAVLTSTGSPLPSEAASPEAAPPDRKRAGPAPGRESQKPVLCIGIAHTLIKTLANRGRPHMTEPARRFR